MPDGVHLGPPSRHFHGFLTGAFPELFFFKLHPSRRRPPIMLIPGSNPRQKSQDGIAERL